MRPDLAVLIDADNIPLRVIPDVLDCLLPNFNVSVRKAFGAGLTQKLANLRETGFEPIEVLPNTPKGKNVTDIALVSAMIPELFFRRVHGFAVVTGDSDFTGPVLQIRNLGIPILVFGPPNTPLCLQSACSRFYTLKVHQVNSDHQMIAVPPTQSPYDLDELRSRIAVLFREFSVSHGGDLTATRFGHYLKSCHQFSAKHYGARSISKLLKRLGGFQLTEIKNQAGTLLDYKLDLGAHRKSIEYPELGGVEGRRLVVMSRK